MNDFFPLSSQWTDEHGWINVPVKYVRVTEHDPSDFVMYSSEWNDMMGWINVPVKMVHVTQNELNEHRRKMRQDAGPVKYVPTEAPKRPVGPRQPNTLWIPPKDRETS